MKNDVFDSTEQTRYSIIPTSQFRKDYKLAKKRGLKMEELAGIIVMLANGKTLPEKHKDHELSGDWTGHRECHIQADWLLIYRIQKDILVLSLVRTGTHSDLFTK